MRRKSLWNRFLSIALSVATIAGSNPTNAYAADIAAFMGNGEALAYDVGEKSSILDELSDSAAKTEAPAAVEEETAASAETEPPVSVAGETTASAETEPPAAVEEETAASAETEPPAAVEEETASSAEMGTLVLVEEETTASAEIEPFASGEEETASSAETETLVLVEEETTAPAETETEAAETDEMFMETAEGAENLDLSAFASARLVVMADSQDVIVDPEHVIGAYGDIYLMQYETVEQSGNAYLYYLGAAQAVEPDTVVNAAGEDAGNDGERGTPGTEATEVIVTQEENPVEAIAANSAGSLAGMIALVDTGAGSNVVGQISLIDDVMSGNGHGDAMAAYIVGQNPEARIFSIRALDDNGQGTVSSIVSAMEYAIDNGASIINLSLYARISLSNTVLATEIGKAVNAGILVVGAAGNDGANVANYMPGSVEAAYIIGACGADGQRIAASNFGSTVDYNVAAQSTSEAAAKFTGYISRNGIGNIGLNAGLVYETDYEEEAYLKENPFQRTRLLTYIINAVGMDAILEKPDGVKEAFGLDDGDLEELQGVLDKFPRFVGAYEDYSENRDLRLYLIREENPDYEGPCDDWLDEDSFYEEDASASGFASGGAIIDRIDGSEAVVRFLSGEMAELIGDLEIRVYAGAAGLVKGQELDYSWEIQDNTRIRLTFEDGGSSMEALLVPDSETVFTAADVDGDWAGKLIGTDTWNTFVGSVYYSDYLGFDPDKYIDWLKEHQTGDYYLGTPYIGGYGAYPNGDTGGAAAGMNCTSFVWHVLWKAMSQSGNSNTPAAYGLGTSRSDTLSGWTTVPRNHGVRRIYCQTKADMFQYADLQYGDIIWIMGAGEDTVGTYLVDNHVGIYVGDGTTDAFWQSTHASNYCDGTNENGVGHSVTVTPGNVLSEITSKQKTTFGYIVFKVGETTSPGQLRFKKKLSSPGTLSGLTDTIKLHTTFTIYSDEACSKEVKSVDVESSSTSAWVTVDGLACDEAGTTYYMKETGRSTGCAWISDTYKFTVYPDKTTETLVNIDDGNSRTTQIKNVPFYFYGVFLKKTADDGTSTPVRGAVYRVWYTEEENGKRKAAWTWYMETDEKGELSYDQAHLTANASYASKSSDFHFETATGKWALPTGYLHVKEVYAPDPYGLDKEIHTKELKATKSNSDSLTTPAIEMNEKYAITSKEPLSAFGYVKVRKKIADSYVGLLNYTTYDAATLAEVTAYSDEACTDELGTLKTSGTRNTSEESDVLKIELDAANKTATVYLKETSVSSCAVMDANVYAVTVTEANTAESPAIVEFANGLSYVAPLLYKYDADNGNPLSGAQFTIQYYDTYHTSENAYGGYDHTVDGYEPAETWVVSTDSDGYAHFDDAHLVSGTLPKLTDGTVAMPYGVYVVTETKAPDGYDITNPSPVLQAALPDALWSARIEFSDRRMTKVRITKKSTDPGITADNGMYSFAGAEFTMTGKADDANTAGRTYTFTCGEDGTSNIVEVSPGTYTLTETNTPKGYRTAAPTDVTVLSGSGEQQFEVSDEPIVGSADVTIHKAVNGAEGTGPSLAGALIQFEYFDNTDCSGTAKRTWVFQTDEMGVIKFADPAYKVSGDDVYTRDGAAVFPLGSLRITEIRAPWGYDIDGHPTVNGVEAKSPTCTILQSDDHAGAVFSVDLNTMEFKELPLFYGVTVPKIDAEKDTNTAQGDATLAGAEFTIYNANDYAVITAEDRETRIESGEAVAKITTNEDGVATYGRFGGDDGKEALEGLEAGTYLIKETSPSTGYLRNSDWSCTITVGGNAGNPDPNGTFYNVPESCKEQIRRSGISIPKVDAELDTNAAQGESTLEGAKFAILNLSALSVQNETNTQAIGTAAGTEPTYAALWEVYNSKKECIVDTITTDSDGKCETSTQTLAYGTYYVIEVESSYGYCINDKFVGKAVIRDEGVLTALGSTEGSSTFEDVCSGDAKTVKEIPRRADLEFRKVNIDGECKAYTPFLISAVEIGEDGTEHVVEEHVIVTDANGLASTRNSERDHSYKTNGFDSEEYVIDKQLTQAGNDLLNALVEAKKNGTEVSPENDPSAWGVWFQDGGEDVIDKSSGALYTCCYRITELACGHNENLQENLLQSELIYVENDTCEYTALVKNNADLITYHPLVDTEIVLTSKAKDVESGTQTVPARDSVEVSDIVDFTHVSADHRYRLDVQFIDVTDNNKALDILGTTTADAEVSADGKTVSRVFKPDQKSGTNNTYGEIGLTALLDSRELNGHTLMAVDYLFEYIDVSDNDDVDGIWVKVAAHPFESNAIVTDEDQLLYVPDLSTQARDSATGDRIGSISENGGILDTVAYTNLAPKESYAIVMRVVERSTGDDMAPGASVQSRTIYRRGDAPVSGTIEMPEYKLDTSKFSGGETAVVVESLYRVDEEGSLLGEPILVHDSLLDENETIRWPEVKTTAADGKTADNVGTDEAKATIYDAVHIRNVIFDDDDHADGGRYSYTLKGKLVYQKDFTDADGVEHKAGEEVKTLSGTKDTVTVTSDASGNAVFTYADGTEAEGTVTVTGYGYGVSKMSGGSVSDNTYVTDNSAAVASVDVTLQFVTDSTKLEGATVVVCEYLYHNEVLASSHAELSDSGQTVHFPGIHTIASDPDTRDNVGAVAGKAAVVDEVQYSNLVIGKEYTIRGRLVNQETGAAITSGDGSIVTAEATFTATRESQGGNTVSRVHEDKDSVDGTYAITFTLDSDVLAGQTVVAFEELFHNGVKVTSHSELHDKKQSVHYPQIHTRAIDQATGSHVGSIFGALVNGVRQFLGNECEAQQTIVDTVSLENLVPGYTYVVSGKLYNATQSRKDDKAVALTVNGQEITQAVTITVAGDGKSIAASGGEKTSVTAYDEELQTVGGTVELTYALDASLVQGVQAVVFETLYHDSAYTGETEPDSVKEEDKVYEHSDYEDGEQSVSEVSIHTAAVDSQTGTHTGVTPGDTASVIWDEVNFSGLLPGMEYTVRGVLVDLDSVNGTAQYLKADGTFTADRSQAYTETLTFTAEKETETKNLNFTVSSDKVQGKSLTVFEDLTYQNIVICSHPGNFMDGGVDKDSLKEQTVYYPAGKTNASDEATGAHSGPAELRTVTDRVYFENLQAGKAYSIEGVLIYQEAFTDKSGVEHKAGEEIAGTIRRVTFTADASLTGADYADGSGAAAVDGVTVKDNADGTQSVSGYVSLVFPLDASELAGRSIVACEVFYEGEVPIFVHRDLSDLPQTIRIPRIQTKASSLGLDEAAVYNEDGTYRTVTITDTVAYENLWTQTELDQMALDGKRLIFQDGTYRAVGSDIYTIAETAKYVLKGVLMDRETGEAIKDADGNEYVVCSEVFTPAAKDGSQDVTFSINTGAFVKDGENTLEGRTVVVFEDLYQVTGTETTDAARTSDEKHIARHHDIDDSGQDIRFPKGRTHVADGAAAAETGAHAAEETVTTHEAYAGKNMVITDLVSFENLHGGTKYTVTGKLMVITQNDANGQPTAYEAAKDDNGSEITATAELDTTSINAAYDASVSGSIALTFTFSGGNLAGKETVAFETVTRDGKTVLVHADITDKAQTIYYPEIRTEACDASSGLHETLASKGTVIIDKVSYTNLESGTTYKLSAALHRQDTGKDVSGSAMEGWFVAGVADQYITADGTKVLTESELEDYLAGGRLTGTDAQTTKDGRCSGAVYVVIPVDTAGLEGKTLVAFETLYAYSQKGGAGERKPAAEHKDLADEKQSVRIPKLRTTAKAGSRKTLSAAGDAEVTDVVKYANLLAGRTYILRAELMDKETGETTGATSEKTFKARETDGKAEIVIKIDASELAGHELVVYETLVDKKTGATVALHQDLDDGKQTVSVQEGQTVKKSGGEESGAGQMASGGRQAASGYSAASAAAKTGDDTPVGPLAAATAAAAAVILAVHRRKRRS